MSAPPVGPETGRRVPRVSSPSRYNGRRPRDVGQPTDGCGAWPPRVTGGQSSLASQKPENQPARDPNIPRAAHATSRCAVHWAPASLPLQSCMCLSGSRLRTTVAGLHDYVSECCRSPWSPAVRHVLLFRSQKCHNVSEVLAAPLCPLVQGPP